jgi:hypothetical protein
MPLVTEYTAFLPVLNNRCITYRGPSWWLADRIQFRSLTEQEARLIEENAPRDFSHRVEPSQRVIVVGGLVSGSYDQVERVHSVYLRAVSMYTQTVFNLIADEGSVSLPFAVVFSQAVRIRLRNVYEFDIWGDSLDLRRLSYRIKPTVTRQEVQELYRIIRLAHERNPEIEIPLGRFCSALLKNNNQDKLIDLTIALESLVPGGGEFRFRFPYFLSLLISQDVNERKQARILLQKVYDARSALVHGASDRQRLISRVTREWDQILGYAKRCILYRILFGSSDQDLEWYDHLVELAYGAVPLL